MEARVLSIGQAAHMIGVAQSSLRRWEAEGKFVPALRTIGGHRRYTLLQIVQSFFPQSSSSTSKKIVGYARVSSHDQGKDLETQKSVLEQYCQTQEMPYEIIPDLGSGINYEKRGLKKLLQLICKQEISQLVLTHRDRLLRFGAKLLFQLCENFGIKVLVLNESRQQSFEQELATDMIEILTVFSSKLYGKRSHANRKKLKQAV